MHSQILKRNLFHNDIELIDIVKMRYNIVYLNDQKCFDGKKLSSLTAIQANCLNSVDETCSSKYIDYIACESEGEEPNLNIHQ